MALGIGIECGATELNRYGPTVVSLVVNGRVPGIHRKNWSIYLRKSGISRRNF